MYACVCINSPPLFPDGEHWDHIDAGLYLDSEGKFTRAICHTIELKYKKPIPLRLSELADWLYAQYF